MYKTLVLASLLGLSLASAPAILRDDQRVITDEDIEYINSNGGWTASNRWVGEMTVAEARCLMGTIITPIPEGANILKADPALEVPDSFDARD